MGIYDEINAELLPELMGGELTDATVAFTGKHDVFGWDDQNEKPLPATSTTYSGTFVRARFTVSEYQTLKIEATDVKVLLMKELLSGIDEPFLQDEITLDGELFRVEYIQKITTNVAWNLQLRRV